ncbi:MAG: EscU/YscU/HrcU family type III secretion system export apparatus switch protein [Terriglobales bacterium]
MADQNKTEQASPRKRQKAREQGQVARSRDLISSLAVLACVLLLAAEVPVFAEQWQGLLRHTLSAATAGDLENQVPLEARLTSQVFTAVGWVVGLSWMAAVLGAVAQGGVVFAPSALQLQASRLSPASRLQQLFSLPSLGKLVKSLVPGAAMVYLTAALLRREWPHLLHLSRLSVRAMAAYESRDLFEVAWKSSLLLLAWSAVDYGLERHKLSTDLRMSRQDLRDEYKETEGHPAVKARIRRLRRQVRRRQILDDVKRASVVITNPNEFAVALEYRPLMPAPKVVAKGRNLLAQQIKQAARWHGIPLVENPPLAHALYRAVEVGQSIPPKLYAVVAAVLAAIYRAQTRAGEAAGKERA